MALSLKAIRVIDFSRVLAGHCAKHLIDLGAEVIKVEPPTGDLSRLAQPLFGAVSGHQDTGGLQRIMREVIGRDLGL